MKTILLVDDDPDIRTSMSTVLSRQGYEVDTACSPEEALMKLKSGLPKVILIDVLLSGADGRDLCREIKNAVETKGIHVIMFSGHPGASSAFRTYGADDFMAKPIKIEELLSKLVLKLTPLK